MSQHSPDPWIDDQLRKVPVPEGLLARLRREPVSDEQLDQSLAEVSLPAGLRSRLLAIPRRGAARPFATRGAPAASAPAARERNRRRGNARGASSRSSPSGPAGRPRAGAVASLSAAALSALGAGGLAHDSGRRLLRPGHGHHAAQHVSRCHPSRPGRCQPPGSHTISRPNSSRTSRSKRPPSNLRRPTTRYCPIRRC